MLLEFQLDWIKTVNFFLVAKFKACLLFLTRTLSSENRNDATYRSIVHSG